MYSHWLNTNYFKTWENNKKPQDYPGMFLFSLFKYHEYKINLKLHWVIHVSVMNDGKQYFIWYWWECIIRLESLLMIWRSIHNFIRLVNKSIRNCFTIQGAYLDNKKYILNTAYVDKEQLYINLKPECKVIWNEIKTLVVTLRSCNAYKWRFFIVINYCMSLKHNIDRKTSSGSF